MTGDTTSNIHRYLDKVFAGIPLTPEVQDLKEEIRGNLQARVSELEAKGTSSAAAARKAIREIGDVDGLIAQLDVSESKPNSTRRRPTRPTTTRSSARRQSAAEAALAHKVKPRPWFAVRATLLSLAAAAGIAALIVAIAGDAHDRWFLTPGAAAGFLGLVFALLVADSMRQETTANHPAPTARSSPASPSSPPSPRTRHGRG